jgi:hypothetical protein
MRTLACLPEQRGAHGVLLTLADAVSVRIGATLWPTALASGQVLGHSTRAQQKTHSLNRERGRDRDDRFPPQAHRI